MTDFSLFFEARLFNKCEVQPARLLDRASPSLGKVRAFALGVPEWVETYCSMGFFLGRPIELLGFFFVMLGVMTTELRVMKLM